MLFDESLVESGSESDIEEDPDFPLPCIEDQYADSTAQPHPPLSRCTRPDVVQPLPLSASLELELLETFLLSIMTSVKVGENNSGIYTYIIIVCARFQNRHS